MDRIDDFGVFGVQIIIERTACPTNITIKLFHVTAYYRSIIVISIVNVILSILLNAPISVQINLLPKYYSKKKWTKQL